MRPAAFASTFVSFSVLFQVVLFISTSTPSQLLLPLLTSSNSNSSTLNPQPSPPLLLFILGAMADYGMLRKRLMIIGAVLGGVFTAVFMAFSTPDIYWLGGIFIILSNLCYGYSVVFYNAFLPVLLRSHPDYINVPPEDRAKVRPPNHKFPLVTSLSLPPSRTLDSV